MHSLSSLEPFRWNDLHQMLRVLGRTVFYEKIARPGLLLFIFWTNHRLFWTNQPTRETVT